jgi:hypothetical protein
MRSRAALRRAEEAAMRRAKEAALRRQEQEIQKLKA